MPRSIGRERGRLMAQQLRGVGIGLRRPLYDTILSTTRRIDWLELVPENFMDLGGRPAAVLEACAARWPLVSHGVSLSIGGPDPLHDLYIESRKRLESSIGVAASSDHLCYTSIHGVELHELLPLPFTEEAVLWS